MTLGSVRSGLSLIPLLAAGCAHVEPPPGGPEDLVSPSVASTTPPADAVVPDFSGPVVVSFDERISRTGVEDAVIVSPRTSPVSVSAGRTEVRVSLREGWEDGVIYHVTIGSEVSDLFSNRLLEPVRLVFSTGPDIPATAAGGSVIDRITGEPEVGIRVEAIRADSLVYATVSDSIGMFVLDRIPPGDYQLRAFRDMNSNRALDVFEPRDSANITIVENAPATAALRVIPPDSTAPLIAAADVVDGRIELEFDDYLDPEQPLQPAQVRVVALDGTAIGIGRVGVGELPPSEPDTTTQAPADTLPGAAVPADTLDTPVSDAAAAQQLPAQTLVVELTEGETLEAGTEYTVEVTDILNLAGLAGSDQITIDGPEPDPDDAAPDDAEPGDPAVPGPADGTEPEPGADVEPGPAP
ncbi:MAG: Ig-like domain-containing protein [Gemmatimonadota bacterium]